MVLLFTPTGFLEIAIFVFAILAFALAVRFFVDSRKRLEALFPDMMRQRKLLPFGIDRSGFLIPKTAGRATDIASRVAFQPAATSTASDSTKAEMKVLRTQLQQQQQELSKALQQIALLGQRDSLQEEKTAAVLAEQRKLEELRLQLEDRDAEIHRLRQTDLYAQKLQERLEEVQTEFDKLQEKMAQMEKQAWQAAELTIQLEHAEHLQLQMEKTLRKKEDKLQDVNLENQQLQAKFDELQDKLTQMNLQRLQLEKKVQFLEDVNADMLHMADTNRKLSSEISRVAELESMLQLMTEERNSLMLRRR